MTLATHETELADELGAGHAIAFAYARHGLIGILRGLGLGPGDRVVLSPLTCRVVPLALLSMGLEPVWADIDQHTLNLDAQTAAAALGLDASAILFQHTYGNPGGLAEVACIANRAAVPLVEDRAQCMPTPQPDRIGVASIYSNNLIKPLPAGSGGVATTDDDSLADAIRHYRDGLRGRTWEKEPAVDRDLASPKFVTPQTVLVPLRAAADTPCWLSQPAARR